MFLSSFLLPPPPPPFALSVSGYTLVLFRFIYFFCHVLTFIVLLYNTSFSPFTDLSLIYSFLHILTSYNYHLHSFLVFIIMLLCFLCPFISVIFLLVFFQSSFPLLIIFPIFSTVLLFYIFFFFHRISTFDISSFHRLYYLPFFTIIFFCNASSYYLYHCSSSYIAFPLFSLLNIFIPFPYPPLFSHPFSPLTISIIFLSLVLLSSLFCLFHPFNIFLLFFHRHYHLLLLLFLQHGANTQTLVHNRS